MSGIYFKSEGQYKKAKNVYYKQDNAWKKVKALRYKKDNEWTKNLISDMEFSYSVGSTEFLKYPSYAEITVFPDSIIGQIGMSYNQPVNMTSISSIRFLFNKQQSGNVSGVATFSIYTEKGGSRDQFTIKSDVSSFGNDLNASLAVSPYTGEYYIRVHLLMNPTVEVGAISFLQLKAIFVTENNVERTLWNAEG